MASVSSDKTPKSSSRPRAKTQMAGVSQQLLDEELEHSAKLIHAAVKAKCVKDIQEELARPLIRMHQSRVLNTPYNQCPPLVLASRHNCVEVVEYLLTLGEIDIEQTGMVMFLHEEIHGAAALWTSAACGHLEIVKKLIDSGADVTHSTNSGSTPLRAACYDGHLNVVKLLKRQGSDINMPNKYGHTPLMIACYKQHDRVVRYLLNCGVDVNRQSELRGNTALHDAAEAGNTQIVNLLLEAGATVQRRDGDISPLLSAAAVGQSDMVHYLHNHRSMKYTNEEYVEAMELLGSAYVDRHRDNNRAVECWQKALDLREKCTFRAIIDFSPQTAYRNVQKPKSSAELTSVASNHDSVEMLALAVREQILGISHPDTPYYIRYRGAIFADRGDFDRCMLMWTYALDIQIKAFNPGHDNIYLTLGSCAEVLHHILSRHSVMPSSVKYVVDVTELAFTELRRCRLTNSRFIFRIARVMLHLTGIWLKALDMKSSVVNNKRRLYEITYNLVQMQLVNDDEETLLHLAVSPDITKILDFPAYSFPCEAVLALLIACGAEINATDKHRRTALHTAIRKSNKHNAERVAHIISLLADAGVSVNARDCYRKRAIDYVKAESEVAVAVRKRSPICLQELAAVVIVDTGIDISQILPLKLTKFVNMF
ncbi:protein fem-1 homolog C-like [Corticium candelabrum]|uniref:protein fem-1 homolog C-like n=1 Tax=Corticium candelabrum TaxID=121492 RepID=UPI002E25A17E|nr:protein fem-1 homolog C-like [Corticium candelabrum]